MNLDEPEIEKSEVLISQNEYTQRQVRLVAALLDLETILRQKEANLAAEDQLNQFELAVKEAA